MLNQTGILFSTRYWIEWSGGGTGGAVDAGASEGCANDGCFCTISRALSSAAIASCSKAPGLMATAKILSIRSLFTTISLFERKTILQEVTRYSARISKFLIFG